MSHFLKAIDNGVRKHTPEILTGFGIAGMLTTVVLAVKATPKAIKLIEVKKEELDDKLTRVEVVKTAWRPYIPAVATFICSTACLIGANSVHARRGAVLATAYKLSETALNEFKDKAVEVVGEKRVTEIKESIANDKVKNSLSRNGEVIVLNKGTTLCYDLTFGRYFKSDIDTIKNAMYQINRAIICDMHVSLNDFYCEIGLPPVKVGYELGWNIDDGEIKVDFSSHLSEDGTPCLAIGYNISPRYEYYRFA